MLVRFFIYGALGWCIEIIWTAVIGKITNPFPFGGGKVKGAGWGLMGVTYLWMFPIYGLIAPLYEPLHDAIRLWPLLLRAVIYAGGFMGIEYTTGWLLRCLMGACPWDYTGRARWHLHGLMRLDYAPLWALLGLALETIHDFLVRLTPAIYAALGWLVSKGVINHVPTFVLTTQTSNLKPQHCEGVGGQPRRRSHWQRRRR